MDKRETEHAKEPAPVTLTEDTQQLIRELGESGKKRSRLLHILTIANVALAAAVLITLIVLVPRTLNMVSDAQDTLNSINEIAAGTKEIVESADGLLQEAETIMGDSETGLEAAVNNFNSVDFETLNKAINDLADAVEPLANLSRLFD